MRIRSLKSVLLRSGIATFTTFIFAMPVVAETWECVVDKTKRQDRLPSSVTIQVNAETGEILVMDDVSKSWGRPVVVGRMITDNAKRQTISWTIDGLPGINLVKPLNFPYTRMYFMATRYKAN